MKVGQLQKQIYTPEKSTLQHYTDELQGSITYPTAATMLRGGVHDGDAMFIYQQ